MKDVIERPIRSDGKSVVESLIHAMPDDLLTFWIAYLKRTRKRIFPFGLNGKVYFTTRKQAVEAMKLESEKRKENISETVKTEKGN